MGDYTDDMNRAIEQLDSINLQDTARRRPSLSSSSLSEEGLALPLLHFFSFKNDWNDCLIWLNDCLYLFSSWIDFF